MIPTKIKQAIIQEFISTCEAPANKGKIIAISTLIRRVENKYGLGYCKNIDETELWEFIKHVSGL